MTAMQELIDRLRLMMDDLPSNSSRALGLATAADLATDLKELEKELLDAAREDEAVGFSRFLYYGTWETIGDNGEDMLYKSYKTGEERFASELYQLYLKSKQKQAITDIMNDDAKDGI